jgi:hypothetical protein
MKATEFINEAPLADYQPIGDFSKPGPFRNPTDKKLAVHSTNILKTYKFFEKTPYDFRIFVSNVSGTGKHRETGPVGVEQIKTMFPEHSEQILKGHEDAITIVYVGNSGDARAMFTPWIMAHRLGHAIQSGVRYGSYDEQHPWRQGENHFFRAVNNILAGNYGKNSQSNNYRSEIKYDMTPEYNALFNAIGTQRSSRNNEIRRPYEFLYEMFAQYLKDGHITLNPLPVNLTYGRQAWGNPTQYMNIRSEFKDEAHRQQASDKLATYLSTYFDEALGTSIGKILVM